VNFCSEDLSIGSAASLEAAERISLQLELNEAAPAVPCFYAFAATLPGLIVRYSAKNLRSLSFQ
jgi:hypothetical protein